MSIWKIIKSLKGRQLFSIIGWFVFRPFFMVATIIATIRTLRISQNKFPDVHGKHNKANAFRHALWNYLIAKFCSRFTTNNSSILNWTKKITDWHEMFSPNEDLAAGMDFHNNAYGRNYWLTNQEPKVCEVTDSLIKELNFAVKFERLEDLLEINKMVYLED